MEQKLSLLAAWAPAGRRIALTHYPRTFQELSFPPRFPAVGGTKTENPLGAAFATLTFTLLPTNRS
jgi:hypothetical protein